MSITFIDTAGVKTSFSKRPKKRGKRGKYRKTVPTSDRAVLTAGAADVHYSATDGMPLAEPPKSELVDSLLPAPDTEGKPYLEKELMLARVEVLLMKGVVTPSSLGAALGVSYTTANKYIEQVHYRWAALGERSHIRQVRGEARARLKLITNELWVIHSNADSNSVKLSSLNQIIAVHDREMILDGLTPKVLDELRTQVLAAITGGKSVSDKILDHDKMLRLSTALQEYTRSQGGFDDEIIEVASDG